MHQAKVFLTVCAGVFLLALSYHLGARSAGAASRSEPYIAGFTADPQTGFLTLVMSNGEVFRKSEKNWDNLQGMGNFFWDGWPHPRGKRGAAQTAQDR